MFYVYFLRSQSHREQINVCLTANLRARLSQHNSGAAPIHTPKVFALVLLAYFAFANEKTAVAFERHL